MTFTNVMFTSTTFLYDSVPNRVLTGAERTIAFRSSDKWALKASATGKITAITKDYISVEYVDGKTESFQLGRYFGTWSGTTIPHDIVTQFKVGDRFDKDDILTYNKHYFEPDSINPKHVIFKRGIRGNVLLWEAVDTIEDADSISADFAKRLGTGMSEKRHVPIQADHEINLLVKEGDIVDPETILCTLRPPMSGLSSSYDESGIDALDTLNTLTPKAKYRGVVDRISVMYSGEIDNMSESLRDLVERNDSKLYRLNKILNNPVTSARISPTYAIKNVDVGTDKVVIVFYITEVVGAGIGDKMVLGNQMKTIISNIVDTPYVAEDGTVVDITFSRQSIANRIVDSMDIIGTSNTVLRLFEKQMIEDYLNTDTNQ